MRRPHVWHYDWDDMLMWNTVTYNDAYILFVQYLTRIWGNRILCIQSIGCFQQDIDVALGREINPSTGKLYGFSSDRYPESLVRTYRWLCEQGFGIYDEATAAKCREIGMRTFDETNYPKLGFVPGAEEVLNFHHQQHHRLVLVTKGVEYVQNRKINALGGRRWFKKGDVYIVEEKTPELFQGILSTMQNVEAERTVMVGNSPSDIMPALKSGMIGIFVPCPTWKGEKIDMDKLTKDEKRRLVRFENISEIIPWFESLDP